jgi:hypothetical protein
MQRICSKTHAKIAYRQAKIISFNALGAALLRAPTVCSKIPRTPISRRPFSNPDDITGTW